MTGKIYANSISQPFVKFETEKGKEFTIEITYSGENLKNQKTDYISYMSEALKIEIDSKKKIRQVYDPQELIKSRTDNLFNLVNEERKRNIFYSTGTRRYPLVATYKC